ncbi:uncharacterized protein HHUB_2214 [Halobacterium hubeiense]|uniref:Uncharacterized protein n=1 Tax=Halobacterium hubeiense TaxID=1407499 RepID=A0A0U5GZW3_9EURY|nr:uncharacterized protein HHUB_2214 [Halobacterium hubeiense]
MRIAWYKILSIYNIPFFTPTSPLSTIPFIWGAIVLIAFLRLEVEYDSLPD